MFMRGRPGLMPVTSEAILAAAAQTRRATKDDGGKRREKLWKRWLKQMLDDEAQTLRQTIQREKRNKRGQQWRRGYRGTNDDTR